MTDAQDFAPWAATAAETLSRYGSDITSGLTDHQSQINTKCGGAWPPIGQLLRTYLAGRIVLLAAAAIGLLFRTADLGVEPLLVLLVVAAECAVVVGRQLPGRATARCVRGGAARAIRAGRLVWGDLIELRSGDTVPADCRVVRITSPAVVDGIARSEAPVPLDARPDEKTCVCFLKASYRCLRNCFEKVNVKLRINGVD
jgi:hypothetical protein